MGCQQGSELQVPIKPKKAMQLQVYGGAPGEAPTVTIIGAGLSGASAANALATAGFDVRIIEARDRIGGRSWTNRETLSKPVDLGAGWIH